MTININPKLMIKNIFIYTCLFLIFLFPYNESLFQLIYPKAVYCFLSVGLGILGLIFLKGRKCLTKRSVLIFVITTFIAIITLMNNYYLKEGNELKVILYTLYLYLPFAIVDNNDIKKPFIHIITIFSIEHIIGTYIGLLFKDYYKSTILPIVCTGRDVCTAIGNNHHGYMTGLTSHFSTNAIYLSISSLLFFTFLLKNKNKKNVLIFIISIIALFTAGKRAHLVFTILCCITLYILKNSKDQIKKYARLLIALIASVFIFIIVSKYVPEINNIITRFEGLIETGDVMNGREELYSLAFKLFDMHPFFGTGWGAFSYYYQMEIYSFGQLSYLNTHNVFIQLLCEIGIFGFLIFASIMFGVLINSYKQIKEKNDDIPNDFCFAYQLFFILYCFTGNPLYDSTCYVVYFFAIGLVLFHKKGSMVK